MLILECGQIGLWETVLGQNLSRNRWFPRPVSCSIQNPAWSCTQLHLDALVSDSGVVCWRFGFGPSWRGFKGASVFTF